jgi:hypothetical protein
MKRAFLARLSAATFAALILTGSAYAGDVTIAWDPNVETDIAGYLVWYGTRPGVYASSIDVGNRTVWALVGLPDGQRYFFAVQAYNSARLMSPLSAEVVADLTIQAPPAPPQSGGGSTGSCTTVRPGTGWTCVNGGWLPPGYPGSAGGSTNATTGAAAGGSTSGTIGGTSLACTTVQPGAGWRCVNGGWLPPGYPGVTSGTAGASTGAATSGTTGGTTAVCTTVQPGAGWTCVNGGWLPPGYGGVTSGTAGATTSGTTGGTAAVCTTVQPGAGWTCVNGGWLPPGYSATETEAPSPTTSDSLSTALYLYQLVEGSGLTGWVQLSPDPTGTGRFDAVRNDTKIGQWSGGPMVVGSQFTSAGGTANLNSPAAMELVAWQPANGTWSLLKSADGTVYASQASVQWGSAAEGDLPVPSDYDGDGKTDLAVWRPSSATWYVVKSTEAYDIQRNVAVQWGENGDVPVPADFDGDGKTDLAVWRPLIATWYVLKSTEGYDVQRSLSVQWGESGDVPVQRDYDGDGKADIAVWRPSISMTLVLKSSEDFSVQRCLAVQWGAGTGVSPCPVTITAK